MALDPWAHLDVTPEEHARWERRHRADVTSWQAQREQDAVSCGCWRRDCAECLPKIADGHRPAKGVVRRFGTRRR